MGVPRCILEISGNASSIQSVLMYGRRDVERVTLAWLNQNMCPFILYIGGTTHLQT